MSSPLMGAQKVVDTLVKFSSDISPHELFEEECKKEISARALWLPDTVSNSPGRYQTASQYLQRHGCEEFPQAMFDSLTCLAQTRKVGDLELMLFYGFQKENDDVETGMCMLITKYNAFGTLFGKSAPIDLKKY
ncbi:hypothetical protein C8J56DRAFT_1058849 [Mycena floridula]|nr:hypothetical protein C8J56DRAFT_1058849 [Mycena floridula]